MLSIRIRKFTELYGQFGYGAVKNLWLLVNLITVSRSVNLNKMKDFVGGLLGNERTRSESHYKRITRFINSWHKDEKLLSYAGKMFSYCGNGDSILCCWMGPAGV